MSLRGNALSIHDAWEKGLGIIGYVRCARGGGEGALVGASRDDRVPFFLFASQVYGHHGPLVYLQSRFLANCIVYLSFRADLSSA